MPDAAKIDYVSMDTAGPSGGAAKSCPTFIIERGSGTDTGAMLPAGNETAATFREKLPPLACGKLFTPATMTSYDKETDAYSRSGSDRAR